ncbi:MAG: threo-3-hydroxy-L-aspartate ammonia-lyase [Ignavibacteriaceae bacterium]
MFTDVLEAAQRLKGIANKTPVLTSNTLNKLTGAEVFLKCENFQKVGAFKFRGAYNAISKLPAKQKEEGVIAYSSGNHAQAVALAGKMLGVKIVVVMPLNAPSSKKDAAEQYGAKIVFYDPDLQNREDVAQHIIDAEGYTLIPPFDHPDIITGQGTAALELINEVKNIDILITPCGGGGLLSGSALAAKSILPDCRVIGVEPELADDAVRSFYSKQLQSVKNPQTIADGARTTSLGKITFPLILKYVDEMKTVSEQSIADAVKFLFYRMKIVVEPTGAMGIAALLSKRIISPGRIGVIVSGGNVDGTTMSYLLKED